jgi:conjugative relaxase-like TrwC/TraI family protein
MIGVRKLSPGGYEYLTGSVACADRTLEPGESLADYYFAHGYPPGQWFGAGAATLGMTGQVTREQMQALFGEGRHPDADRIQAAMIAAGATPEEALAATKLGNRFAQYDGIDKLRSAVIDAYKQHNKDNGRPIGAPIDDETRARIRRDVQNQAFANAHQGRQPTTAELGQWLAEQKRSMKSATAGYELVIAPPKSVSVAFALGDEQLRELVVSLHRQAVTDALTYFENNIAYTRKGAGGVAQFDVQGITAAMFEHWDSRAGDPHLHTHVTISTKVQGPDGKWTSLDGRTVLAAAVTLSEYYNSRVRDLFREHGASWTERPAGGYDLKRPVWELDGVPNELILGFSQRAAQVEAERARQIVAFRREHDREPSPQEMWEISLRAQYGTRDPKQAPQTLTDHLRRWGAQALTMVSDRTVITTLRDRILGGAPESLSPVNIAELAHATRQVVSDHYSHFNTWNLEAEAHRQTAHLVLAPGTRDGLIADVVGTVIAASDTIALTAPSLVEEPASLRRRSDESVFVQHNSQRFTTEQTLREEAALAAWGRLRGGHRLTTAVLERTLAGSKLNAGQKAAVAEFATSGRRVQLLYAPAGTGKTTAMRVFAQAWRETGGTVYAFGPSARAAQELGKSIDATPHTLHQVTTALRYGNAERAFPFAKGDVLIIDEAAMAGTHTLHDLVRYALRRGADIRMIGDDRQLTAVEAGGAVRWFAFHNGVLRLREVVRFVDRDQAAASLLIRDGNPQGLDYYLENGRVHSGSRETIRDAAHRAWRADLDAGVETLLIVPTNEDVVALNLQARELRIRRGALNEDGRSVPLHDGTSASAGDWIVTRQNDRLQTLFGGKDFVKNGDTWDLLRVRRDGSLKVRHRESGGTAVLPAHYVQLNVELAYAATVNRSQGMDSRGNAHEIVPRGTSREQFYTGTTRAHHENHIYVETHQHTIDSHQETPLEQNARDVLVGVLAHSSAETSATEELRDSLAEAGSLRPLVVRHNYVAQLGAEERIDAVLTELTPTLLASPATPALRQTLHTAEDLGWQVEHLVPAALAHGPLDDARDPAAVLQWRVEQITLRDRPPQRTAAATSAQINHWRTLIEQHDPRAAVEDPNWMPVWQRAAAAAAEGLDADTALTLAATRLATRPPQDPMTDHQFAGTVLSDALAEQRATGQGWHPVLPWLAQPDYTEVADQPDLLDFLARLSEAMTARMDQLRATVTANPPDWTAGLGERPADHPAAAQHWDRLATLGASFRDTYTVNTDDPRYPLGEEPDSNSLRARSWRDLMDQWGPYRPGADAQDTGAGQTANQQASQSATTDRLRAGMDPDDLFAALNQHDGDRYEYQADPLSQLVDRYRRGVSAATDDYVDAEIGRVLTERAPSALGAPAADALTWVLRQAHAQGWRIDQIVPDADSLRGLDRARDPAAVLYRRVEDRLHHHNPPETANHTAAAPVPWLETADPATLTGQPDLAAHLDRLASAIDERLTDLRDEVTLDQPQWTTGLGPRPSDRADADAWDELAGLAAAYRETYHVTTQNPNVPLGPQPSGNGPRAHAWKQLTNQWRPPMSSPEDYYGSNQDGIDEFYDRLDRTEADRYDTLDDADDPYGDSRADAELDYLYDDDADLHQDTDFSEGLGPG